MVIGDFDLSGIGTVTHVEGDRVYGFGHPMFSLGACELPMMTGYIHTVYPRASVSMKMGSPLKVVGVIDTDVSTSVAGRIGPKPDMLPLSVRVKTGQLCRCPHLSRADGPRAGALADPDHVGAHQRHRHRGEPPRGADGPAHGDDPPEGSRADHGVGHIQRPAIHRARWGPRRCSARWPRSSTSWSGTRWRRSGSSRSTCDVQIEPGRKVATIESVRLLSDTVEPGHDLKGYRHARSRTRASGRRSRSRLPIPADFPEGHCEAIVLRRRQQHPADGSATIPPCSSRATWRVSSIRSGSRPSRSGRRSTCTSLAGSRAVGPGAGPAQLAGQRPGGLRLEARGPGRPDPLATWSGSRRPPGSSRGAVRSGSRWPRTRGCRYRCIDEPKDRPGGGESPPAGGCRAGPGSIEDNEDRNAKARVCPAALSALVVSFLFVGLAAASSPEGLWSRPARAKVETWRQEGPAAFAKCHRESVVISDNGRVRLGHSVAPVGSLMRRRVWDLARTQRRGPARGDR